MNPLNYQLAVDDFIVLTQADGPVMYSWLTKVTEHRDMIFGVTQIHPLTESAGSKQTALWIERKFTKNIGVYIIYTNISLELIWPPICV